jgi:hypothetical protein
MALQPFVGPWPLLHFLDLLTQTVGLLGRGISPSQGLCLYTGQHKHRINAHANIHVSSRIRTYDPSVRASEDSSCLKSQIHTPSIVTKTLDSMYGRTERFIYGSNGEHSMRSIIHISYSFFCIKKILSILFQVRPPGRLISRVLCLVSWPQVSNHCYVLETCFLNSYTINLTPLFYYEQVTIKNVIECIKFCGIWN